jgi:DNA polymerase-3 subunit delta'
VEMRTRLLPWFEPFVQNMAARYQQNQLPQGLILPVDEVEGAQGLARQIAHNWLCAHKSACGKCKPCNLYKSEQHPDFIEIHPDGQQIKIDQIRLLSQETLKATHFLQGLRVVVLYQADRLNVAAANALLKTLEEPESNTVFLMMTTKVSLLPPTIRSRCQLQGVPKPATSSVHSWIGHQAHHLQSEQIEWLLLMLGGVIPVQKAIQDQKIQAMLQCRSAWMHSLKNQVVVASDLVQYTEKNHQLSLAILHRLLVQKIERARQNPHQVRRLLLMCGELDRVRHDLSRMATMNFHALCQSLMIQYKNAVQPEPKPF